ncbi:molybdopterin-dependent oxidoreductase [Thermodesulfobacteriota bacterium]
MADHHPSPELVNVPVTCNKDCGAACPLIAHIQKGRLVKIRDNPLGGPYLKGCARGYHTPGMLYAPDRIKKPLLRSGQRGSGNFTEMEWPEALDRVADGLSSVKDTYGPEAIIRLGGSGSCLGALHHTGSVTARFLSLLGGYTETEGNYSAAAIDFVSPFLFGEAHTGIDPDTFRFSKLIILWGANISDTRFGCNMERYIRESSRQGTRVVIVDPCRSRTAARLNAEWIPVLPGTDSVLMIAVLYVLLTENHVDQAFTRKYAYGFERLEEYVLGLVDGVQKTPEWASPLCGTPIDAIYRLAGLYGKIRPAALIPGLSIQRTLGGEEAVRMAVALQVAMGNVGLKGGSTGGNIWNRLPRPRCGSIDRLDVPGRPAVPVYCWPDAILEGQNGGFPTDIHAIYNVGGNFLSQGSDIHKNIRAFHAVDFSVCHDHFLTPTAGYCDIVLPVTMPMEREDIIFPQGNYLLYSHKAVDPPKGVMNDYDIFCRLAEQLGFLEGFSENKSAPEWLESFLADSEVKDHEEFKRVGIFIKDEEMRVGLSDFIADPQKNPLNTPSGRIEISSAAYAGTGFPAIPKPRILEIEEEYPLRLISPHARYRINSQLSNAAWSGKLEKHKLWMNPVDASSRGISEGHQVFIFSPFGKIRIPVKIKDDMLPGVVCLAQGIWPVFDKDGTETAGSVNVLTSTTPTMPSQGARTHSILVEVEPVQPS